MVNEVNRLLGSGVQWAHTQPCLEAVALVESRARHAARTGSDIDLVLLVQNREPYLQELG